ncbi:hypothetical protein D9758_004548 [Tetrapyrgos nigripes]|uniref:CNH domain-containing protein n=1 Tax=Tetrapyrgos nigripes TaxID=182062 RepID=A0A8H5H021_9AGAR|nr:hypothetical protein D9758_004548 [Tetrapyrgos nigripes]
MPRNPLQILKTSMPSHDDVLRSPEPQQMEFRSDLVLLEELLLNHNRLLSRGRRHMLIHKGSLDSPNGKSEISVWLLDDVLVFTKAMEEALQFYRPPIPLPLLTMDTSQDSKQREHRRKRRSFWTSIGLLCFSADDDDQWIEFTRLGSASFNFKLLAKTPLEQREWVDAIYSQSRKMQSFLENVILTDRQALGKHGKINCAVAYNGTTKLLFGAEDGVYAADFLTDNFITKPLKVLTYPNVKQISVVRRLQMLVFLSKTECLVVPLSILNPDNPSAGSKTCSTISKRTLYFTVSYENLEVLVNTIASSGPPIMEVYSIKKGVVPQKEKRTRRPRSSRGIPPSAVNFVRGVPLPKHAVSVRIFSNNQGSAGWSTSSSPTRSSPRASSLSIFAWASTSSCFSRMDFESSDDQQSPSHSTPKESNNTKLPRNSTNMTPWKIQPDNTDVENDADLRAAFEHATDETRDDGIGKPVAMFRIGDEFLLCYNSFAFYLDQSGRRTRKEFLLFWEGKPTAFAIHYPVIVAIDPTFAEVRHLGTGELVQVIQGHKLYLLHAGAESINFSSSASYPNASPGASSVYGTRRGSGLGPGTGSDFGQGHRKVSTNTSDSMELRNRKGEGQRKTPGSIVQSNAVDEGKNQNGEDGGQSGNGDGDGDDNESEGKGGEGDDPLDAYGGEEPTEPIILMNGDKVVMLRRPDIA